MITETAGVAIVTFSRQDGARLVRGSHLKPREQGSFAWEKVPIEM
jgi:hypothetical protein